MAAAHAAERLESAHLEVKRACDLLIASSPEALETCQLALQGAVFELTEFKNESARGVARVGARSLACGLLCEVHRAARLLQNLAGFYEGWERILGTLAGGYTGNGEPAPVTRRGRLSCRG